MPDASRPTEPQRSPLKVRFLVIAVAPVCLFVVTSWVLFAIRSYGLRWNVDSSAFYGFAFMFFFGSYGVAIAIIDSVLALVRWPQLWIGLVVALITTTILATVGWYRNGL